MSADEVGYDFKILDAVMDVNAKQKVHLIPKIKAFFGGDIEGKHFALWGLSFKPNTDDVREAPAFYIIDALIAEGATVSAFDPEGMANTKLNYEDKINFATNQYEALVNADALIIATEWNEFRTQTLIK